MTQQLRQQKDLSTSSSSSTAAAATLPKRYDPAVETNPSLQISRFDLQQLREWLLAIANASTEDVEMLQGCAERLVQQVERDLQSAIKIEASRESPSSTSAAVAGVNHNGKRRRDISAMTAGIFGTTTMAGRYEQMKLRPKSSDDSITAGKIFLKMNIAKVIRQQTLLSNDDSNSGSSAAASAITVEDSISDTQYSKAADIFRNAITRRTKADAVKKQEDQVHEQEKRKQQLEYSFDHQTKRPRIEVKPQVTSPSAVMNVVLDDNDDFNLEDLVGGPISVIRGAPPPQQIQQLQTIEIKEEAKQPSPAQSSSAAMDVSPPSDIVPSNITAAEEAVVEVPLTVKVKGKPKKAPKVVFS